MSMAKNTQSQNRYSFRRGWMRVPPVESKAVKQEILEYFDCYSRPFWTEILYGRKPLTLDQMEAIEAIFINHKVKKSNIWGQ